MLMAKWLFPDNRHRKTVAFNNQGVAHFTGDRFHNVVRETVQNSLDAARDENDTVIIKMHLQEIPANLFDGAGLGTTITQCLKTSKVPNDRPTLRKMADYLTEVNASGSIPALVISDHNTTGASDIPESGQLTSMWEALTNSEGVDVKSSAGSGGSHGIGKNAPYNISIPRTILYSTRFKTGANGQTRSLFIGRALLVSHTGADGQPYSHEGYLGAEDFNALEDDDIATIFRRDVTGLTTYILGFAPPEGMSWQTLAAQAAVENFSHGIVQGKVIFDIDGNTITAENIRNKWVTELPNLTQETLNFIELSAKTPEERHQIDGIGEINLYLETTDDPDDNRREVALVRDSGMLITSLLPNMNLPGMRREASLPRNLKGFTAIIECLSHGEASLIRDAETANHTAVRPDIIEDQNRRKLAEGQLTKLGRWVKNVLQEKAKREVHARIDSADELNEFIALTGEALPSDNGVSTIANFTITKPRQMESGVPAGPTRRGRRSNVIKQIDEEDENQENNIDIHDPKKRKKRKTRRKRASQSSPNPFPRLRFMRTDDNATHQITAMFDSPSEELRGIKLLSIGEDGSETVVGLKNQVEINGKKASVKNNTIRSIQPVPGQSRVAIKFDTQEPVIKDGKQLKSFHLRHGDNQS